MRAKIIVATGAAIATGALFSLTAGATLTAGTLCDKQAGRTVVANSVHRIYWAERALTEANDSNVEVLVYECVPGKRTDPKLLARTTSPDESPRFFPTSGQIRGDYLLLQYVNFTTSTRKRELRLYNLDANDRLAAYTRVGTSPIPMWLTLTGGFGIIAPAGLVEFDSGGSRVAAPTSGGTITDVGTGTTSLYWRQNGAVGAAATSGPPAGVLTDPS